ncbi:MAG: glycoside hydrolase [Proteobacteria bacterium]|nr:glycoside hydrolase [Pseudomonadota bacterium]MDA0992639.1 glycoside hydrolase [Pseudomonadota bacterium]
MKYPVSAGLSCSLLLMFSVCTVSLADTAGNETSAVDSSFYQELRYRLIGPFRAGRTVGAVGVPSQPNVFYIGVNNGGVWKTDDFGHSWKPIFDQAHTGSVGDIAVSPSNPDIIYVGTGEGLHRPDLSTGDGIFKSIDGGANWAHIGLPDVQQVGRIIVHPTNPDIVFVAGLGHPYGPNEERGVFRTSDGGTSWEKVLYLDENTGAIQVDFDPADPRILFASLWEHREGPWENAAFSGDNSGLYKSTDGGDSWQQLGTGLPGAREGLGRIGIGIAPGNPQRIYATVDAREHGGIYRSNDGGESWQLISTDNRLWGRGGDFAEIRVHPHDEDVVFVGNIASYRSDDGGTSWTSIKGAPGGDDYHRIWINPEQPDIMLFAADQGATITINGGRTWSSWYNQPTAQLYHVSTDNQFPYWIYGGQQESGAIGIASRGNGGQISFRDWMGVGADEYAYVAPDPLNADIIYGGRVVRFNKKTGQTQNVAPEALRSGNYRTLRSMPLTFHPADPTMLLYASNVLWKTHDGGQNWEVISPDLSREQPDVPESIGDFRTPDLQSMTRRGVIYALGASPRDKKLIWAGTDDGLIHVTQNAGRAWRDVTPKELRAWDKVSALDAGHFDKNTAYAAINAIRRDDLRPHIYRTHDGGQQWTRVVTGLPESGPVNVVREDPLQPGLLFAGTERTVYFSIDDGAHWSELKMNMPASSVRDLVIHGDDLVIGTHGRSIWVMDNISPLRQLAAMRNKDASWLFAPVNALRVRWNMFSDTPLPPEEPTGENPLDGAVLDYYLATDTDTVTLEILDADRSTVRRFSSNDAPEIVDPDDLAHPTYWIRPSSTLAKTKGHHRLAWDLRYEPPKGVERSFDIAAVYQSTPSGPQGPFVHPGRYTVRLTVGGDVFAQEIDVALDPRVEITDADLRLQTRYSLAAYRGHQRAQTLRDEIDAELSTADEQRRGLLLALRGAGDAENPDITYGSISAAPSDTETLVGIQTKLIHMLKIFQAADARPNSHAIQSINTLLATLEKLVERHAAIALFQAGGTIPENNKSIDQ